MYNLTLQVYGAGIWQDAMTLSFAEPSQGFLSPCRYAYKSAYVAHAYQSTFAQAVSARLPVDFDSIASREAPAFVHDIAPSVTFNHPGIALQHLDRRLNDWGLL
jgi:serine/threonine-protein kinase HipA